MLFMAISEVLVAMLLFSPLNKRIKQTIVSFSALPCLNKHPLTPAVPETNHHPFSPPGRLRSGNQGLPRGRRDRPR